ncbi:hypothetical protein N7414_28960 [Pseudomonas sp. GD04087]|uniref:hypothetical protein n=1 Tax=unclassified Pseudomonas TaxID=196821 RepID=UPI002447F3AA|nr:MULTISPECIES: hypothetical protein [unclassified Pseudomonas]MDH0293170.1 hypothetical protein [Pseudomonas sp. GD04087]MDH1052972.1 hypothetical protein [Pseudomonas sp. GD03903]MDH2003433.1 hypothetical protein [Pseudomonas sp. GD03691]
MTSHTTFLSDVLRRGEIASQIERYVEAIKASEEPAYNLSHDHDGEPFYCPTSLAISADRLKQMHAFIMDLDDELEDEALGAFQHACRCLGLEFSPLVGMVCLNESEDGYLPPEEALNWLVKNVRAHFPAVQE